MARKVPWQPTSTRNKPRNWGDDCAMVLRCANRRCCHLTIIALPLHRYEDDVFLARVMVHVASRSIAPPWEFDFVWLPARTPHGGASYVWWARRNQEKHPPEKHYRAFFREQGTIGSHDLSNASRPLFFFWAAHTIHAPLQVRIPFESKGTPIMGASLKISHSKGNHGSFPERFPFKRKPWELP